MILGDAGALLVTRYLESLLFGVASVDAVIFVGLGIVFATVAAIATIVPAKRAVSVDPLAALRHE